MAFGYVIFYIIYYHIDNPNLKQLYPLFVLPFDIDTYYEVIDYNLRMEYVEEELRVYLLKKTKNEYLKEDQYP